MGVQESPELHAYLGFLDLREAKVESAKAHFERALDIATDRLDALYTIVDLCLSESFAGAVRPYAEQMLPLASSAIASDPGNPDLYAMRAAAYSAVGESALAERDRATQGSLLGWWEEPETSAAAP